MDKNRENYSDLFKKMKKPSLKTPPTSTPGFELVRNNGEVFDQTLPPLKIKKMRTISKPEPVSAESDPRIKSPDEFLSKITPKEKIEEPEVKEIPVVLPKVDLKEPTQQVKIPLSEPNSPMTYGMNDLARLREELAKERRLAQERAEEALAPLHPAEPKTEKKAEPTNGNYKFDKAYFSNLFGTAGFTPEPVSMPNGKDISHMSVGEQAMLIRQHIKEIAQWKEYAHQVKQWQSQVMSIVQTLKNQLKKGNDDQAEIKELKEQLLQKDQEIQNLRTPSKHRILGWLKNFQKVPR